MSTDPPTHQFECRVGCGACCIAPSISSPTPGMPNGKPAGVRCVQLTSDNRCALFGKPERPAVCLKLRPMQEMCGDTYDHAFAYLTWLERETSTSSDLQGLGRQFSPPSIHSTRPRRILS